MLSPRICRVSDVRSVTLGIKKLWRRCVSLHEMEGDLSNSGLSVGRAIMTTHKCRHEWHSLRFTGHEKSSWFSLRSGKTYNSVKRVHDSLYVSSTYVTSYVRVFFIRIAFYEFSVLCALSHLCFKDFYSTRSWIDYVHWITDCRLKDVKTVCRDNITWKSLTISGVRRIEDLFCGTVSAHVHIPSLSFCVFNWCFEI